MRTVILLAGPSGSGKSRVARLAGCPKLNLDDFYRDGTEPGLPHRRGIVDWDDPASWDLTAARSAVLQLCQRGTAMVPVYDIAGNRPVGWQVVTLGSAAAFVAEGLFAPELAATCREAALPCHALYLDRSRTLTLILRFVRDVREHRKPVGVLLRRGLALWREEPEIRRHAIALGCRPVSLAEALGVVRACC